MTTKKIPYGFTTATEQQLAVRLCSNPRVCGSLIGAIDIDRINNAPAALALRVVWTIHKELGAGPSSPMTVMQRLERQISEGKITSEQRDGVLEMLAETSIDTPNEQEFLNEIVPILQRRAQGDIISEMALAHGSRADVSDMVTKLQMLKNVGLVDRSVGDELTVDSITEMSTTQGIIMPTGIDDLDLVIEGGVVQGSITLWMAPTSGGKSMAMCHSACTKLRRGVNVALATLELPVPRWKARVLSNLTGVPSNAILDGTASRRAQEKFARIASSTGRFFPKWFPPGVTTLEDILQWVGDVESQHGCQIDSVVIDYLGKLNHDAMSGKGKREDLAMGETLDRARSWALQNQRWMDSAAQAKRSKDDNTKEKYKSQDIGDSYKMAQNTDYLFSVTKTDDNSQVSVFVAKQRNGDGEGKLIGPMPANFALGRIAPLFTVDDM